MQQYKSHSIQSYKFEPSNKFKPSTLSCLIAALFVTSTLHAGETSKAVEKNESTAEKAPAESQTLEAVTVEATAETRGKPMPVYAGGQVATAGKVGLLGNKSVMDTPFSMTSYTQELIQNQQASTVADVVANDPSVRIINPRFGRFDQFTIRGFNLVNSEIAFNGLYGIVPTYTVPVESAERVEIFKGPNALLNGMSPSGAVGGSINVVPKRATDTDITQFTASYATESVSGGHLDVGRRFGSDGQFGVRVNAVRQDGKTVFGNDQEIEKSLLSLALDYRGEKLRLSSDIYHYENHGTSPLERVAVTGATVVPSAKRIGDNFAQKWSYADSIDSAVMFRGEYDIAPLTTAYAAWGARRGRYDFLRVSPIEVNSAGDFSATTNVFLRDEDTVSSEAGIRNAFTTGFVDHAVNFNTSLYKIEFGNFERPLGAAASNIYNPVNRPEPSTAGISDHPTRTGETELVSFALTDTLSVLNERVQLTLGARKQRVIGKTYNAVSGSKTAEYDEDALTPTAAIVVKPVENVSLFANYIEALTQTTIGPNTGVVNPNAMLPPGKSKQIEAGVKVDLGKFTSTMSIFRIKRPSTFTDPVTRVFGLNGEQQNTGLEFNVFGEPFSGVRVLGGFMLLDAELTKTIAGVNEGNTAVGVAKVNVNLGSEWDISYIPGLTLTARAIYTGDQYVNEANTREIPDWTRFDLGSRYVFKAHGKKVTLRANIENAFDKRYWSTASQLGLTFGTPRTAVLSATLDF
jgi:iron complex outermembrane recepter protein